MIEFIYGACGSGKTCLVFERISEALVKGKKCFLIIPDQEALDFERRSLSVLPGNAQLNLEILGFSRLYNRVCREYGGLSYSYVTKPVRSLIMWKSLRELEPLLTEYKRSSDACLTDLMLSAVSELKASGTDAHSLEKAAAKLDNKSPLSKKLLDVSAVYSFFDNAVSEKYSDSADDLSRLRDVLGEHGFFEGSCVFIDSFTSFTAVQHQIIENIFGDAESTVITFPLSSPRENGVSVESIARSHKRLSDAADKFGGAVGTVLGGNRRAKSASIAYLSENIWKMEKKAAPTEIQNDGGVVFEVCKNPYTEAEAVAAHIMDLLKKGARCRDIVVIMRDADKYRGIIEPALQKSGIPFFLSEKSALCSMPSVKLILSALRIKKYNWQTTDVISYVKTGLCGVNIRDAELFEEYVKTWNIKGSGFTDGEAWTMNPDGLVAEISPRGEKILLAANSVKKVIVKPLEKLFLMLDAAENVGDMCRALYKYSCDMELESKLSVLARKAEQRNDIKQARELSRIYGVMLNALASVGEAVGDEKADCEELMLILKIVFDKTEISSIPTSIDEVTVGSASTLRASNKKYAMVVGLCEGEFPSETADDGIFNESDRQTLSSLGITLTSNEDTRFSDELMYVQRAFASPSDKLYLFTHCSELGGSEKGPSFAYKRARILMPEVKEQNFDRDGFERVVPAPRNALSFLRSMEEGETRSSLALALEDYFPQISNRSLLTADGSGCRVSPAQIKNTIGNSLRFSPSSFEKYVSCPFSYYCSYVLNLREKKTSDFKINDMGSFIHFILEVLLKESIPKDTSSPMPDDAELVARTDKAVEAYIERVCPPFMIEMPRMKHLYRRLRTLSLLLVKNIVEEFSKSRFRPAFFELRTNGKDGNPSPMTFRLDDGTAVSFSGIIDRVDLYRKDENVYVRVVDYKTGTKVFSLDDVDRGFGTQMLLYLFTLCRNTSSEFKRSAGIDKSCNAIPAGVVYLSANIPVIDADGYLSNEEILKKAEQNIKRTGILLAREDILSAMNEEFNASFIAGIKKDAKSGEAKGAAAADEDTFKSVYERLEKVIKKFSSELKNGVADARPARNGNYFPCDFCEAKPFCRKIKDKSKEYAKEDECYGTEIY